MIQKTKLKLLVDNKNIVAENQPIFFNVLLKINYVLLWRILFLFHILIFCRIVFYISVCKPMLETHNNNNRGNTP